MRRSNRLPLSLMLVRRMPLTWLTRRALFASATVLAFLDIRAWLLLPFVAFAQTAPGAIVVRRLVDP